jgi:hypothetical protein
MAPILSFLISSGSKKKEPRCVCMREAKALHTRTKCVYIYIYIYIYVCVCVCVSKIPRKSPLKDLPPCSPNRVCMQRDAPSPESMVYPSICICRSPPKRSPPTKYGENIRSPSTEPQADGRPTYNGVRLGSPRGSLTTLLSLPHCHAAISTIPSTLAWVDQSPVSQRVS